MLEFVAFIVSCRAAATAVLWNLVSPGGALVIVEDGSAKGSHTVRSARQMVLSSAASGLGEEAGSHRYAVSQSRFALGREGDRCLQSWYLHGSFNMWSLLSRGHCTHFCFPRYLSGDHGPQYFFSLPSIAKVGHCSSADGPT